MDGTYGVIELATHRGIMLSRPVCMNSTCFCAYLYSSVRRIQGAVQGIVPLRADIQANYSVKIQRVNRVTLVVVQSQLWVHVYCLVSTVQQ
eukprot:COSAG06_NODE_7721_length_2399_cov_1.680435_2_plen_91_part_00